MSKHPVEVTIALHVNNPQHKTVLVSDDGEHSNAVWIPRSQIACLHLNCQTTKGTDRDGRAVRLPLAVLTIPEWLAKNKGLI